MFVIWSAIFNLLQCSEMRCAEPRASDEHLLKQFHLLSLILLNFFSCQSILSWTNLITIFQFSAGCSTLLSSPQALAFYTNLLLLLPSLSCLTWNFSLFLLLMVTITRLETSGCVQALTLVFLKIVLYVGINYQNLWFVSEPNQVQSARYIGWFCLNAYFQQSYL
jgi:hypothetical protein